MIKPAVFLFAFFLISIFSFSQSAGRLHYKAVLVDTHNDVLSSSVLEGKDISHRLATGQSDLDRWKEGGVDVQFFSVWTDKVARNPEGFFKDANQEIDSLDKIVARNPKRIVLARTYSDVEKGIRKKD